MIEDAPLLRQYATHRDESAFAELVRRHLNLVYSAAMRRTRGDAHRAEEIAQFVFNELARNAATVARHPTLAGWLHTATRNAALNDARSERRRRLYEQEASIMNETITPSEPDADWTRIRSVLDDVIDNLGQQDRDAVVLRFLEERPFAAIGRALRISEVAARMRTERALEKLRHLLVKRGVTSTGGALSVALAGQTAMAAPAGMAATITGTALATAIATGSTGLLTTLWAALTGTKIAVGATGTIVVVAAGITAFAISEQSAPARPNPVPATAPAVIPAPIESNTSTQTPAAVPDSASREITTQRPQIRPTRPREPAAAKRTAIKPVKEDPKAAALRQRNSLLRDYAPLFDRLGFAPDRREQLLNLLVDERETSIDFAAAGGVAGVDVTADSQIFDASVRMLRDNTHGQIEMLLGTEGYKEYKILRKVLQLQSWADGLEKKLRRTQASLSAEQGRQLTSLLLTGDVDPKGTDVIVSASQFLTPAQILALRELQQERIAGSKKQKVQDAVREGAARASPGP